MGKHKKKLKKHKEHKKSKKKSRYSSSSSSEDEWVEKKPSSEKRKHFSSESSDELSDSKNSSQHKSEKNNASPIQKREDWFSLPANFLTASTEERRRDKKSAQKAAKDEDKYNPAKSTRELNPYWKGGGDGLPSAASFVKPSFDENKTFKSKSQTIARSSGWRKNTSSVDKTNAVIENDSYVDKKDELDIKQDTLTETITEKDLNKLASRLIKAEILGDKILIEELKSKLEHARTMKTVVKDEVILTHTDNKGFSRPITSSSHGETSKPGKRVDTHANGERLRYFADDDKYSLKNMFENEKLNTVESSNKEFLNMTKKVSKNDDLDDIFTDSIRKTKSDSKTDRRERDKAISEHQKINQSLDNCGKCIQSEKMLKNLMITMGNTFYLSLPPHEPLIEGHCFLIPIRHIPCATRLDENEWNELMDFQKSLIRLHREGNKDVVFFESASNVENYVHMKIECIPLPKEFADLAPIYFKKAIDESETEWSSNKKLVSLKGRNVQKAIPKGLPYFSVNFGVNEGYAHVIEDKHLFPDNFAQEILGGIMDLPHNKWRKPKLQSFKEQSQRVVEFSKHWKKYDVTSST